MEIMRDPVHMSIFLSVNLREWKIVLGGGHVIQIIMSSSFRCRGVGGHVFGFYGRVWRLAVLEVSTADG